MGGTIGSLGKGAKSLFSTSGDTVKGTGLTVGDLKSKKGGSYSDADIAAMGGGTPSLGTGFARGTLKGTLSNVGSVTPPRALYPPVEFDSSPPPMFDPMGAGLIGAANPYLNPNAPRTEPAWLTQLKKAQPQYDPFYGGGN